MVADDVLRAGRLSVLRSFESAAHGGFQGEEWESIGYFASQFCDFSHSIGRSCCGSAKNHCRVT
jgi:hypothetical protein